MKIFQVLNGICHWDATKQYDCLEKTQGLFSSEIVFVEAPDNVFEGWGYQEGNFIQPTPPDGWGYDAGTGTFYPLDTGPYKPEPTSQDDQDAMLVDLEYRLTLLELGVTT